MAAVSDPMSAVALSQWDTQRFAEMRSSVERAMRGIRVAPVGCMMVVVARPTITNGATSGVGAPAIAPRAAHA